MASEEMEEVTDTSSTTTAGDDGSPIDNLCAIFPDVDREVATSVLSSCNNNLQQAVDVLLAGSTQTSKETATTAMEADSESDDSTGGARTPTTPGGSPTPLRRPRRASITIPGSSPVRVMRTPGSSPPTTPRSREIEEEIIEEVDISYDNESGNTINIPGGRVVKHKEMPFNNPFFPLIQCFAGLTPLANLGLVKGGPKIWNLNKKIGVCEGQFAEAFLWMTRLLWQKDQMPLTFRGHIQILRNLFHNTGAQLASISNYDQPDYRDITHWIINALEDDLNTLPVQRHIEATEVEGLPDEARAAKFLEQLQARSRGIITDLFQGICKDTVVCPDCGFADSQFERMTTLGLNIDPHQKKVIEITYIPALSSAEDPPRKYRLHVPKNGVGADLKRELIERAGLLIPSHKHLVITDVYNGRVFQELTDSSPLANIRDRDVIVIYEIPTESFGSSNTDHCFLVHRVKRPATGYYSHYSSGPRLAGSPLCISRSFSRKQVYNYIWNRFKHLFGYEGHITYGAYLSGLQNKDNKEDGGEKGEERDSDASDVTMKEDASLVEGEKGGETEEEEAARKKKEQEEQDAALARKLQAEFQAQEQSGYYSSAWSQYYKQPEAEPQEEEKTVGLFTLRFVSNYGTSCSSCGRGWNCNGCPIAYNDEPLVIPESGNISIDWNLPEEELPILETNVLFSHETDRVEIEDVSGLPTIFDSLNVTLEPRPATNEGGEPWYCTKCKEFKEATRKMDIWELPEVLVIQFARLEQSRWFRSVSTNFVDYPIEGLDLTPYVLNPNRGPCVYDLSAVLNLTSTRNYHACVRNKDNKKWYSFEDVGCLEIEEDGIKARLCTPEACVLFYQKKRQAKSLKDICLLHIARRREELDTSLLPAELREAIASIQPTDKRYFL